MTAVYPDEAPCFDAERNREFEIYARNGYKRIFALAFSILGNVSDAEDATQETFVRAWLHIDQYDRRHPFKNWLSAIARNHIKDHFRKHRTNTPLSLDFLTENGLEGLCNEVLPPDCVTDPQLTVISGESVDICRNAIIRLQEPYQSVLALHDLDGHSYSEIARILQCPLGTVRSRLHRGRALVRQTIERHHPAFADTPS